MIKNSEYTCSSEYLLLLSTLSCSKLDDDTPYVLAPVLKPKLLHAKISSVWLDNVSRTLDPPTTDEVPATKSIEPGALSDSGRQWGESCFNWLEP